MRWDGLFADLEAQWQEAQSAPVLAEARELTRGEWAAITLTQRLRAATGREVRLSLAHGEPLVLSVQVVGDSWIGGLSRAGQSCIVQLDHVLAVEGQLGAARVLDSPSGPLRWGAVLRSLARARAAVEVLGRDGRVLAEGTIDRVGQDHIDVARHARDDARRAAALRGSMTVAWHGIAMVRSRVSVL
ncbi:MAG: hypothetical protein Q4G34_08665 [Micrococcus sp.]|nr:hypothetical protein [Micrococcus sp.]